MPESYNVYNIGDAVILTATFKDATGALADPTQVHIRVKGPSGQIDELIPENTDRGAWRATYSLIGKPQGEYHYRWAGTGAVQVAKEGVFYVSAAFVPN
jgi:hypothetical protein